MKCSIFIFISFCILKTLESQVAVSDTISLKRENERNLSLENSFDMGISLSNDFKNNDDNKKQTVPLPVNPSETIPKIPGIIPQSKLNENFTSESLYELSNYNDESATIISQINGKKTSSILYLVASLLILYACFEAYKHKQRYSFLVEDLEPDMCDYQLMEDL